MEKTQVRIVTTGSSSYRSLLAYAHAINLLVVSADLTNSVSRVGGDTVSESFSAITNGDDPLTVAIPCNIVDTPSND
jgi:hypothetical protein